MAAKFGQPLAPRGGNFQTVRCCCCARMRSAISRQRLLVRGNFLKASLRRSQFQQLLHSTASGLAHLEHTGESLPQRAGNSTNISPRPSVASTSIFFTSIKIRSVTRYSSGGSAGRQRSDEERQLGVGTAETAINPCVSSGI